MKILWFVNISMPAVLEHIGQKITGSGWWLSGLANEFKKDNSIDLTIAHCSHKYEKFEKFDSEGITYWMIPAKNRNIVGWNSSGLVKKLAEYIDNEKFDLIDVHGSEYVYGLVASLIKVPTVITIQGFVSEVVKNKYGRVNLLNTIRQTRGISDIKSNLILIYTDIINYFRARSELNIFKQAAYFIGRTEWDKAMVAKLSPSLKKYYVCWEIMRPIFYEQFWTGDLKDDNFTLFQCGRIVPYRGTDRLIYLLAELKEKFPKISLRLAGGTGVTSWEKYIKRLARKLNVIDRISFLGYLSSEQLAQELRNAAVFVYPSYVDNSSNSLAEAMCIGIPCVSSNVGGITTMIKDGYNGLLFNPDDLQQMTQQVSRVLVDRKLAQELGKNARKVAINRHDSQKVADETKNAYESILNDWAAK